MLTMSPSQFYWAGSDGDQYIYSGYSEVEIGAGSLPGAGIYFQAGNINFDIEDAESQGLTYTGNTQTQQNVTFTTNGNFVVNAFNGQFSGNVNVTNTVNASNVIASTSILVPNVITASSNISLNLSNTSNFFFTLTGNVTLLNPTSVTVGYSGQIVCTQDATGHRTISFGSNWLFPGGITPILSTASNSIDILSFTVLSSTQIACFIHNGFAV
jgi:hypothetical protein